MLEAEITVKIPEMWITEIPKRHDVRIKIVDRRPLGRMGVKDLVEITGSQSELEAILDELKSEAWVQSFDLDFVKSGKLVGEVLTHKCLACAAIAGSDCHLVSAEVRPEGRLKWRFMTSKRSEVKGLVSRLRKLGCDAELVRLSAIDDREVLTERQEEIILMAYERGYFDTPRRAKLKDLARATGVSQATLSEILRKGQKRIVVEYLESKRKRA
jgi:predicted DNA binding protein